MHSNSDNLDDEEKYTIQAVLFEHRLTFQGQTVILSVIPKKFDNIFQIFSFYAQQNTLLSSSLLLKSQDIVKILLQTDKKHMLSSTMQYFLKNIEMLSLFFKEPSSKKLDLVNIEILSHVLKAKTVFHTLNRTCELATFIINPAGEIIIEIFRDFKKNYFFVTSNSKEEKNLEEDVISRMLYQNMNIKAKVQEKKKDDTFVNDILDSLGPDFKGDTTEDSSNSRIFKIVSSENIKMKSEMKSERIKTGQALKFDGFLDSPTIGRTREPKKPLVLGKSQERFRGTLKHFDHIKKFGFIYYPKENREIFFHANDILDTRLTLDLLLKCKKGVFINVEFTIMEYIGKNNKSEKAIDITLGEA